MHQGHLHYHIFRRGLNSLHNLQETETVAHTFSTLRTPAAKQNQPPNDEHQCTKCGKVYRWKKSLSLHLRVECGKEPQFQCPVCPYKAKQKGNLKSHMRVWHSTYVQAQ